MNVITSFFQVRILQGAVSIGGSGAGSGADALRIRQEEYIDCIARNAGGAGGSVKWLHLMVQDDPSLAALTRDVLPRLPPEARRRVVPSLAPSAPRQPTYGQLFAYAQRLLPGQLCMVCNADIAVHPTFDVDKARALVDLFSTSPGAAAAAGGSRRVAGRNIALALTRYEDDACTDAPLIDDYRGSHDAFVFRAPLPRAFPSSVDHFQNCYKAENIVIHELQRHGCTVVNPCRTLRIVHRHAADLRQWFPPVDEERYAKAPPQTFEEAFATLREAATKP